MCHQEIMTENMVVRLSVSAIAFPHNLSYRTGFTTSNGDNCPSQLEQQQFWFAKTASNNHWGMSSI
jgi:hypothetical protein